MSAPIIFSNTSGLALGMPVDVKQPIGELVARTRISVEDAGASLLTGVWECSPGRWRRQVLEREFSHFIVGYGFFVPDHGPTIEIHAGDAVFFPANCQGEWDIRETVRKSFVIIP